MSHIDLFTEAYEKKMWVKSKKNPYSSSEFSGNSGPGSTYEYNKQYINILLNFINEKNVKSICDLGCGDWQFSKNIYKDLDITYKGYDAYQKMIVHHNNHFANENISFEHLDIYKNVSDIENADIFILKDILQHWTTDEIYKFMDTLISMKKCKYIFICNDCNQVKDDVDVLNSDNVKQRIRQLSSHYLPLKKYNCIKISTFDTKEVSYIQV